MNFMNQWWVNVLQLQVIYVFFVVRRANISAHVSHNFSTVSCIWEKVTKEIYVQFYEKFTHFERYFHSRNYFIRCI